MKRGIKKIYLIFFLLTLFVIFLFVVVSEFNLLFKGFLKSPEEGYGEEMSSFFTATDSYCEKRWELSSYGECINDLREVVYANVCSSEVRVESIDCGCALFLQRGLNFISVCEELGDYNIEHILELIDYNYGYILEWSNSDKRYKLWNKDGTREFSEFDIEKSYFIYYTGAPGVVILDGELFGDVVIDIIPGLESPIYPYEGETEVGGSNFHGLDFVYMLEWDNVEKKFKVHNPEGTQEFDKIFTGEGMFIFSEGGEINYQVNNQ